MIKYNIKHICSACSIECMTRKAESLDFRHPHIEHHLCRHCDNSNETYKVIFDKNTKLYGLGDPFGLEKGNRHFVLLKG